LIEYFLNIPTNSKALGGIDNNKITFNKIVTNIERNVLATQDKFNYYFWGYLNYLLVLSSKFKESSKVGVYEKKVFDRITAEIEFLLRFIKSPENDSFYTDILDISFLYANRSVDLDVSLYLSSVFTSDVEFSNLIKDLFKCVSVSQNKTSRKNKAPQDWKYISLIKQRLIKLFITYIHQSKESIKIDDFTIYSTFFVLGLIKLKKYRDKLIFEARKNNYFESKFADYVSDIDIDIEFIIEGSKRIADDSWIDSDDDKKSNKSKKSKKNKKTKPNISDIVLQDEEKEEQCLFKYQENCELDSFIKKLPEDNNWARLSQISLEYRVFIKGKVAVFPGMPIKDLDLFLIPKGLEKIRRHHPDISLSELESSLQVNDKCSFDSSNLMDMLGERPAKGSGLSSHVCDNYMSVPGYTNYVRYHGFINQWFKLVGKPVDIEVSYHHDSKDILQKLLTLNYLSVCSGLRELHIDYSNNICKVGEVIFPKKTEDALKLQKPEDKSKFPFLYIGHQDSIEAERGKYDFEKLLKKNLKRFSEDEYKDIKFKDIIDWSGVGDLIKES